MNIAYVFCINCVPCFTFTFRVLSCEKHINIVPHGSVGTSTRVDACALQAYTQLPAPSNHFQLRNDSLDRHVHGRHIERLKHDPCDALLGKTGYSSGATLSSL